MEIREPVPSTFLGDPVSDLGCRLEVVSVFYDFDAEGAHGGVFFSAVAVWNYDRGVDTIFARRVPDRLAVVASRRRNYSRRLSPFAKEVLEVNEATAHLERSGRRVILVLRPDGCPYPLLEERPPVLRRGRHRLIDQSGGGLQFSERGLVWGELSSSQR
jgi:hypothetical protein